MSQKEKEQEPRPRYPFFGIVGPVGVGKTELLKLLSSQFGFVPLGEQFVENPYLEGFYTEDPKKFSFEAQMLFLGAKTKQTTEGFASTATDPTAQDPDMVGDGIIAEAQRRMRFMTGLEYGIYRFHFERVLGTDGFPRPDIIIALTASEETVEKRIRERGRDWELSFMERYPEYFKTIVQTFNNWLSQNRYKRKTIVIDTDGVDIKGDEKDREWVATEIKSWSRYYIESPHQLGGNGLDGRPLLVPPKFHKNNQIDYQDLPPGLDPHSVRLQR